MWSRLRSRFSRPTNGSGEMPFFDHLEELRWRIIWSLLAFIVFTIAGFYLAMHFDLLGILRAPAAPYLPDEMLVYLNPLTPFYITLKLAIIIGLLAASPLMAYHAWSFVAPALTTREKRIIIPALYSGLLLFAAGVLVAYHMALPMTMEFMSRFQQDSIQPMITVDEYLRVAIGLLLAFGAVFELPVVLVVLSAMGLISAHFLAAKRRYAIAIMAVASALLTPGDALSVTLFMMAPLILLYELSIGMARLIERSRRRQQAEASELVEAGQ